MTIIESTYQRLSSLPKHAGRAQTALQHLQEQGIDVSSARDALEDYRAIERSDYSEQAEYQDERNDAWQEFLEALEGLENEI